WRSDDQSLRDPAAVDVLVAHALLPDDARRRLLGRIEHALVNGPRRGVVRPVAVLRRLDVAVVGPGGVRHQGARGGRIEGPPARSVRLEGLPGDVDVV